MTHCETLFLECWRAGIELSLNGDKLHLSANSKPPEDLLERLKEHKPKLFRFMSSWVDTPHGEGKLWGFLSGNRCGVILRTQPDRVTFIKRSEVRI